MTRVQCVVAAWRNVACSLYLYRHGHYGQTAAVGVQHEITFTAAHEAVCVFVVSPEHGCAGKSSQCDIGTDDSGV